MRSIIQPDNYWCLVWEPGILHSNTNIASRFVLKATRLHVYCKFFGRSLTSLVLGIAKWQGKQASVSEGKEIIILPKYLHHIQQHNLSLFPGYTYYFS